MRVSEQSVRCAETPTLSVIIPVFQTADWLRQCLESVLAQSVRDIELICIDDGCTDDSQRILADFVRKDGRCHLICKRNAGQGCARNLGLDYARGTYVAFVDSDDWVAPSIWEKMIRVAETQRCEMVLCEGWDVAEPSGRCTRSKSGVLPLPSHCFREPFSWASAHAGGGKIFYTSVCPPLRICRRLFIGHSRFPDRMIYEDAPFHFDLFFRARRVGAVREQLYFYRQRQGSTMGHRDRRVLDHLKVIDRVHAILCEHHIETELEPEFAEYAARLIIRTYMMLPRTDVFGVLRDFAARKRRWWTQCPWHARFCVGALLSGSERKFRAALLLRGGLKSVRDGVRGCLLWPVRLTEGARRHHG